MQRAALLRAAAGGPPPSDFPGFRKYSSKENENLACFVCVLRYSRMSYHTVTQVPFTVSPETK